MKVECGNYSVIFDLGKNVYTGLPDSSTGKTRAAKLLKSAAALGRRDILVLDYESVKGLNVEEIINIIRSYRYSLIFADRADRWCSSEIYDALVESEAIVFADFKDNSPENMAGIDCDIEFTDGSIRFYENSI